MATLSIDIIATGDDAQYESDVGVFSSSGTFVRAGHTFVKSVNKTYASGFRFQSITIPQGTVVTSALLTLDIASVAGGTPDTTLRGDSADHAPLWADPLDGPPFDDAPGTLSNPTTVTVDPGVTTTGSKEVDVTALVNEILDRVGWVSGNAMRFDIIDNSGAGTTPNFTTNAFGTGTVANLTIEWVVPEYVPMVHVIESVDLRDGAPNVMQSRHEGDGGNYDWEEGFCGVKASLASDAAVFLRFQKLGDTLPSGTPYIQLYGLADAVADYIDVELFWAAIAAGEKPSAGVLNTEGVNRITWAAGDDHDYKLTEWALNVVTAPAVNDVVVAKLVFKSTSTLAVRSTWKGWLDYH